MRWNPIRRQDDAARLRQLAQTLAALTAGDLTSPVAIGGSGAVGLVEQAAEDLRVSLLHVVGAVQQGLGTLHRGHATVLASNKETLGAAEATAGIAYDAGVVAGDVSHSITVVASAAEELAATV